MAARFVTAAAHQKNVVAHAAMVPKIVVQLRAQKIGARQKRPLEFFFATNSKAKGKALVEMLEVHGYQVVMACDGAKVLVTGVTPPIPMSLTALSDWSADMVSLAFEFDSLFDGLALS